MTASTMRPGDVSRRRPQDRRAGERRGRPRGARAREGCDRTRVPRLPLDGRGLRQTGAASCGRRAEAGQSFRNVVEETKARAEKVMRPAMDRVPIAIVRPSTVVGDPRTGDRPLRRPYLLILLVVTSPPDLALPLPVAATSRSTSSRSTGSPARRSPSASTARGGKTFHVVDPAALTVRQVSSSWRRGPTGPRGSIPTTSPRPLLRTPGLDRIAKSPRAFLETLGILTYDRAGADMLRGHRHSLPTIRKLRGAPRRVRSGPAAGAPRQRARETPRILEVERRACSLSTVLDPLRFFVCPASGSLAEHEAGDGQVLDECDHGFR